MSNALTRAAHSLSLAEKRIIACALATTDTSSAGDQARAMATGGWSVKLLAGDYMELFGLARSTVYEQLKDASDTLIKKQWHVIDGKGKGAKYNWLSGYRYHEKEGWVELHFTHWAAPHILNLKSNFTSYKLSQGQGLKSIYSWRLMECLQSWKSTGVWHVPLDQFYDAMDVSASYRGNFGIVRQKVIDPAIKELRDTENLIIAYKPIKAGRKVVSLIFEFEPHRQRSIFNETEGENGSN